MQKIEIELIEESTSERHKGFRVTQGDKYADALGFDEMLGVLVTLTMPEQRPHLQWMKTKEQHNNFDKMLIGSSIPFGDGQTSF